ncbi:uncharacterized protein LOC133890992 [Phragmites australis]|uniref:uncharacterized protein LOC133890992 n=1 Tax=Phragmites australis TaxID=29695 RepID=UPI002D798608|nr:uncharacterized protein LOC133890992 [Phragmites australis]
MEEEHRRWENGRQHRSGTIGDDEVAGNGVPRCADEEHVASAQTLQEASSITATSSSSLQAEAIAQDTIEVLPPSGRCLSSSPGSLVLSRLERDWGFRFYIRVDRQGSFHTYPDVGGPFQSLLEADKSIDRHLDARRDPKMCMEKDKIPQMDMLIRRSLYWPDGTIKKRTKSHVAEKTHDRMCRLVQALVDKYNEDHYLLGDLAYELKDVLGYQSFCEKRRCYYHLNFTTKIKGADDLDCGVDNLFFAEFKHIRQGKHEVFVSCLCMVNPIHNGLLCYGCINNGNLGMKHPDSSVEFAAGHLDAPLPFGCFRELSDSDDDEKYVKTKEAKLRHMYQGLDDPHVVEELFTLPPGVTIVED